MPVPAHSVPPQNPAPLSPRRKSLFWFWILAAALFLIGLYNARRGRQLQHDLAQLQTQSSSTLQDRRQIERNLAEARQTTLIVNDPSSRQITLLPEPPSLRRTVPALRAWWHPRLGLVVAGVHIPLPAGDRVLQVWLLAGDPAQKPLSAGALRPQPDGRFLLFVENPSASPAATKTIAVTDEPAAGSPLPTASPLWSGSLR